MKTSGNVFLALLLFSISFLIMDSCKEENTVPFVKTNNATGITTTSATTGGNITDDGGSDVTSRGVCWSTSGDPTVADNKTTEGSGTGIFTITLTGLDPGTSYYVRAYGINSEGTGYGNLVMFTTGKADLPILTTNPASSVTSSTAISGGTVLSDGGGTLTARGVCWDLTDHPTIGHSKTLDGDELGGFESHLEGLLAGRKYYARAFATNNTGTGYGDTISFRTLPDIPVVSTDTLSSVTTTSARSGGLVSLDGGAAVTARGVCWDTIPNPALDDQATINGGGLGSFESDINALQPNTTYYVRAYATNEVGTAYGNQRMFTTSDGTMDLTTAEIGDITATSATCGGDITDNGGSAITARGVCWSTVPNPTVQNDKTVDGSGTGSFISHPANLEAGTTYYVRAYGTNAVTTSYGNQQVFPTRDGIASLSTNIITGIQAGTASCGGSIADDGGSPVTVRGVCWSTDLNPAIDDDRTFDGSGAGDFISNLAGLEAGTMYHVRAYATNAVTTSYGNPQSFTTRDGVARIISAPVTGIKTTRATSGGNITSDGGSAVTARGVCWNTIPNPTTDNDKTVDGNGTGIFTSNLTGLYPGTTYHARAYATNLTGTWYGDDLEFKTYPVEDADGNVYDTVAIGDQVWLRENLRTTRYNDGTPIPHVPDNLEWANLTSPAYCWYDNDQGYKNVYGALYTWYTVKTGILCPVGWHVATDADWTLLENLLGGSVVAGGKLKETGLEHWYEPNTGATNESGFTALPGGWRDGISGAAVDIRLKAAWWTSTEYTSDSPWYRLMYYSDAYIYRPYPGDPSFGLSVRCIKDAKVKLNP